jgi:hypothetical protein
MAEHNAPITINTIFYAVDLETVLVIIRPLHGNLEDVMKIGDRAITGNQEARPDHWANAR